MNTDQLAIQIPEFWSWSLKTYDQAGVAEILLTLQDEFGLNVNLVLWCLWAGEFYPGLDEKKVVTLLKSTTPWQHRVTVPLRSIRRDMKLMQSTLPKKEIKVLRRDIKSLELQAERIEQEYLAEMTAQLAEQAPQPSDGPAHLAYMDLYCHVCRKLESADGFRLQDQADRAKNLYQNVKDIIF